uniref:Uncharacterized protein n=1 Tax=Emiliania huxleyi TaxID=2903 RepID=A0A7S3S8P6_EMIHU
MLAASTAGRERCDCDRGSGARDRSCAGAERSTNGRQYVNYDIISNISNIANCSLRWNTRQWILAGTNDAWRRAARDRSRAGAERSTSGRWNAHNNAQTNSIWLANSSFYCNQLRTETTASDCAQLSKRVSADWNQLRSAQPRAMARCAPVTLCGCVAQHALCV